MRTSLSAGPGRDSGARLHVKAVPERKADGTRLWAAGCGVIPQLDRIGGAISQDPDPKQVDRRAWQQRVKDTFDYASLAALIK